VGANKKALMILHPTLKLGLRFERIIILKNSEKYQNIFIERRLIDKPIKAWHAVPLQVANPSTFQNTKPGII